MSKHPDWYDNLPYVRHGFGPAPLDPEGWRASPTKNQQSAPGVKQTDVQSELERLHASIDAVEKAAGELVGKLPLVMTTAVEPAVGAPDEVTLDEGAATPLGQDLRSCSDRLDGLMWILSGATRRVSL